MQKIINKTEQLVTKRLLKDKLATLGITNGDTLLVHTSLSSIGFVSGGAQTIIDVLRETLGDDGTVVMPSQNANLMAPMYWEYPPVNAEWWDDIMNDTAPYNKEITPTSGMGQVAELFRTLPSVMRSDHPLYSFTAYGKHAQHILSEQSLNYSFSATSPLGKLYALEDAKVLLIGVDFEANTALHLAEYDLGRQPMIRQAPIEKNGEKLWVDIEDINLNIYDDFLVVEEKYAQMENGSYQKTALNAGYLTSFNLKECVDFAHAYWKAKMS